jgi:hypothetical protein
MLLSARVGLFISALFALWLFAWPVLQWLLASSADSHRHQSHVSSSSSTGSVGSSAALDQSLPLSATLAASGSVASLHASHLTDPQCRLALSLDAGISAPTPLAAEAFSNQRRYSSTSSSVIRQSSSSSATALIPPVPALSASASASWGGQRRATRDWFLDVFAQLRPRPRALIAPLFAAERRFVRAFAAPFEIPHAVAARFPLPLVRVLIADPPSQAKAQSQSPSQSTAVGARARGGRCWFLDEAQCASALIIPTDDTQTTSSSTDASHAINIATAAANTLGGPTKPTPTSAPLPLPVAKRRRGDGSNFSPDRHTRDLLASVFLKCALRSVWNEPTCFAIDIGAHFGYNSVQNTCE